jgi:hypothetical protein
MLQKPHNLQSPPFSDQWWESFLQKTSSLTAPGVFENCFDGQRREFLERSVLQVVREICRLRTDRFGFRIWLDGEQMPSTGLPRIFDNPPLEDERASDWAGRLFPGKEFAVIINTGEKYVEALSQDIATLLAPLFARIGFPRDGINYTLFIGNYDKTPLGIHQDSRGENVMHFHLGPARKTMYVWTPETFEELTKANDRKDVAALTPHADTYAFGPGDLFFMPEGTYHIGEQQGLSMGLTVWQYNHSNALLMRSIRRRLNKRLRKPEVAVVETDTNDLEDTSGLDNTLSSHGIAAEFGPHSYEELLRETYRERRYAFHSNAGYIGEPFFDLAAADIGESSTIQKVAPYKILVRRKLSGNRMHVYTRGHRIEMSDFDCIGRLIDRINEGSKEAVSALLDLLDPAWDRRIGTVFLSELCKRRGIEVLN